MAEQRGARIKARALALGALTILFIIKSSLAFVPYRFLRLLMPPAGHRRADGWIKMRTARAIHQAACRLPSATCLPQALAGNVLFSLQGYHSVVRIGVAPGSESGFRAHAWLLCGDDVVIGNGDDLGDFATLTDLGIIRS